jgi:hypothetical protein
MGGNACGAARPLPGAFSALIAGISGDPGLSELDSVRLGTGVAASQQAQTHAPADAAQLYRSHMSLGAAQPPLQLTATCLGLLGADSWAHI